MLRFRPLCTHYEYSAQRVVSRKLSQVYSYARSASEKPRRPEPEAPRDPIRRAHRPCPDSSGKRTRGLNLGTVKKQVALFFLGPFFFTVSDRGKRERRDERMDVIGHRREWMTMDGTDEAKVGICAYLPTGQLMREMLDDGFKTGPCQEDRPWRRSQDERDERNRRTTRSGPVRRLWMRV